MWIVKEDRRLSIGSVQAVAVFSEDGRPFLVYSLLIHRSGRSGSVDGLTNKSRLLLRFFVASWTLPFRARVYEEVLILVSLRLVVVLVRLRLEIAVLLPPIDLGVLYALKLGLYNLVFSVFSHVDSLDNRVDKGFLYVTEHVGLSCLPSSGDRLTLQ